MNNYDFNSYVDFGIFCKINAEQLNEVFNLTKPGANLTQVDAFIKSYEFAQGGCPCSLKKRTAQAQTSYHEIVTAMSNHQPASNLIKELLGEVETVSFKDSADVAPFLSF